MPDAFDKLAFETAQMARIGWFFGQKLLAARFAKPVPVPDKLRGRKTPDRQRLIRDLWQLVERDWQHIAEGVYAPPDDWRGNPLDGLRRAADFFADLRAVEARRHGDLGERLMTEAPPERYPPYYRRKFHFQTDGYLSEASAERYDYQVEVLFGGGAAAMRRQGLVPLRGTLLLVDSLQTGDEPEYDALLDYFPYAFHEPYYASYVREDLDRLFSPGFLRQMTVPAYFSKVVSWRRDESDSRSRPKM